MFSVLAFHGNVLSLQVTLFVANVPVAFCLTALHKIRNARQLLRAGSTGDGEQTQAQSMRRVYKLLKAGLAGNAEKKILEDYVEFLRFDVDALLVKIEGRATDARHGGESHS